MKIITQCKTIKPRKFKKNYFKMPITCRDIDWFMIKESLCIYYTYCKYTLYKNEVIH